MLGLADLHFEDAAGAGRALLAVYVLEGVGAFAQPEYFFYFRHPSRVSTVADPLKDLVFLLVSRFLLEV